MHLTGPKRKALAGAVTLAATAGLTVGLAGTAAAVPVSPPGTYWAYISGGCSDWPPPGDASTYVETGGPCILSTYTTGGGDEPFDTCTSTARATASTPSSPSARASCRSAPEPQHDGSADDLRAVVDDRRALPSPGPGTARAG